LIVIRWNDYDQFGRSAQVERIFSGMARLWTGAENTFNHDGSAQISARVEGIFSGMAKALNRAISEGTSSRVLMIGFWWNRGVFVSFSACFPVNKGFVILCCCADTISRPISATVEVRQSPV